MIAVITLGWVSLTVVVSSLIAGATGLAWFTYRLVKELRVAMGVKLETIHKLVNSRLQTALTEIDDLRAQLGLPPAERE